MSSLRESIWSRLARDSGYLVGGQVGASVLRLSSLAIAARVLGPADYGSVALIIAYAATAEHLCSFQSWQAVIRYGASLLGPDDERRLRDLLTLGFSVDLLSALAAALVAFAASFFVFPLFDWDPLFSGLGRIYLLTIPFRATGAFKGALRLFGRFDLIARQSLWGPAATLLLLVGMGLVARLAPTSVVLIYAVGDVVSSLAYLAYGRNELRARGLAASISVGALRRARDFPGFVRFLVSSNLNGTSKLAITQLDVLLSGLVLGTAGAGFYRIVKSLARVITTGSGAVYETLYPEFAKLVAAGKIDRMMSVGLRMGLGLSVGCLVGVATFGLVGAPLIDLVLGSEYFAVHWAFVVYGIGLTLQMLGIPVSAMLLALDLPSAALGWYWLAAVLFTIGFLLLGSDFGLLGACAAFSLYWMTFLSGTGYLVRSEVRALARGSRSTC